MVFKKLIKKIQLWFELKMLREKIRNCEYEKKRTGKQQFLIKFNNGKVKRVDSEYRRKFNKKLKGKVRKMEYSDLCNLAIYKTN